MTVVSEPIRLLCLSDPHCAFQRYDPATLPNADIAIIAGDFTKSGCEFGLREFDAASAWIHLLTERYSRVLYVLGNHDLRMPSDCFDNPPFCESIEQQERVLSGLRFRGASLSPCFDLPYLALMWTRMTADRGMDATEWDGKPYADVIVSHCPPEGVLDAAGEERHIGSPGLRRYIQEQRPRLVICGHVHEAAGVATVPHDRDGRADTIVINCALNPVCVTIDEVRVTFQND